jgi:hypothetical protein
MASASHVDLTRIRSEHHGPPNPFLRALQATVQAGAEDPPPPRIFTDAEQRVDAALDALGETAEELQHRVEVALPAIVLGMWAFSTVALTYLTKWALSAPTKEHDGTLRGCTRSSDRVGWREG